MYDILYSGDNMLDDSIIDRVSKKTNVNKKDVMKLVNDIQTKDLNNTNDIQDFIRTVAKVSNKSVSEEKINKITSMIKNNQIPRDIDKML